MLVDTSALIALVSPIDRFHPRAVAAFQQVTLRRSHLIATSYVLLESHALLDRRFGRERAGAFEQGLVPLFEVLWVDERLHLAGLELWRASTRRLSLVDAVSLAAMRQHALAEVWTYDRDFDEQGCEVFG